MKKILVLLGALAFSGAVFGQGAIYNAAIRQAHGAVAKTQAASAGATAQLPQPPSQNSPQNNPVLAATMQNISNLRTDFDDLGANSSSSSLTNDLAAAAMGTKASAISVAKLAGDLQKVLDGNSKLAAQHQRLAGDIHAIFNAGQLPSAQQKMLEGDVRASLTSTGVPEDQISVLEDDIHAVENETK